MTTSEAVPFAKTGGLADAVSALSLALADAGHDVRIIMPRYYGIDRKALKLLDGPLGVPMGWSEEWAAVYETKLPRTHNGIKADKASVPVYFIDHEGFFGRDGVYGTSSAPDFPDNPRRFAFFSRAVFQFCRKLGWFPDILHAHDWPSALVPVFLKYGERCDGFENTKSVLTIHNLGYQGVYSKEFFPYTRLGWELFIEAGFNDWERMNLLKAGIVCADHLNTVSPTYAEETKTPANGFRLDEVLRARSQVYEGILNGVDYDEWNPSIDRYIPYQYDAKKMQGKARMKEALQKEFKLPVDAEVPLIGMVTRLTEQKGVGELFGPTWGALWNICQDMRVQVVLIGSGEAWCEQEIRSLSDRLPNFSAKIGYSEKLSHYVESGSDFFLMPSRYEPCGLNQMYSLAYGTIPIVRNTGGLADTVENYNEENGEGTGFMFNELAPRAIYDTVGWAVYAWYNKQEHINQMRIRGMNKDFSWKHSASLYIAMYERICTS